MRSHARRIAAVLVAPALVALTPSPASAAVFSPTSSVELIADINLTNVNAQDDVIDLGGNTFTLTTPDNLTAGSSGLPIVTGDSGHSLTIQNGTIQRSTAGGTPNFRILLIADGDVTLDDVTFANGAVPIGAGGGAIHNPGSGTLTLTDVVVVDNVAESGGGIHSTGPLVLTNSTVRDNTANIHGGGILGQGAVTLTASTLSGNNATLNGGGIFGQEAVSLTGTTVNGNDAGTGGAGLFIDTGALELSNSTVSGNTAVSSSGGIRLDGSSGKIWNSTVVDNTAPSAGANIFIDGLPGLESVDSTIIAEPQGGPSCNAGAVSGSFNLDGDGSCGFVDGVNNNQVGTNLAPLDPLLGPLANNGGPTETHALLAGSPAIDAGSNPLGLAFDQRGTGFPRPQGPQDDIGAFEATVGPADTDNDGISDDDDNCPSAVNPDQEDTDGDDIGDVCDPCTDTDADGVGDPGFDTSGCPAPGVQDNCVAVANPDQADVDADGLGDACDPCPVDATNTCDNEADVSISKDDGVTSVTAGGSVTYTIAATNAGPDAVTGATVEDTFPAALTDVTWTCAGTDGGTCTGAGSGNISDTVNLPVTGTVTYTVNATVSSSASGSLSNTAKITPPAGTTDPDPEDATDTDTDTIVIPDSDGDGLKDPKEASIGTNPNDPDTDDDGLSDGREWGYKSTYTCLNLFRRDTDGDGIGDGTELFGLVVNQYYTTNADNPGTKFLIGKVKVNPCKQDTDGDGLTDRQEIAGSSIGQVIIRKSSDGGAYTLGGRKTHPLKRDTDGDGLSDKLEITGAANWRFDRRKSDPTSADTDWGGSKDGYEVLSRHTDPTRAD